MTGPSAQEIESAQKKIADEAKEHKSRNLALSMDEVRKAAIVNRILQDVSDDDTAKQGFLQTLKEILEVYEGQVGGVRADFEGAANVKTMVMASVVELLHSSLYPAVYNEDLLYWVPESDTSILNVPKVTKMMRWATRRDNWASFVDQFCYSAILEGPVIVKERWDVEWSWVQRRVPKVENFARKLVDVVLNMTGFPRKIQVTKDDYEIKYDYIKIEKSVSELLPIEDVGFPMHSIPGSDETRLHHIWHRTRPYESDLRKKFNLGIFIGEDKVFEKDEEAEEGIIQNERARQAREDNSIGPDRYAIVEYYGEFEVPVPGGSGETKHQECVFWVHVESRTLMRGCLLTDLNRRGRRPFVITGLIPRKNRMLYKGMGHLMLNPSKEMDTIHNQRLDAVTMAIAPPVLYRAASGMKPELIKTKPGLWVPVDDVANDARSMVQPNNNVVVSFQEERLVLELIERLTSIGSLQAGQESNIVRTKATARGTMAVIQQGEKRGNTYARRLQHGLARVLRLKLNNWQDNIPPGIEDQVLGDDGERVFPETLSPEAIAGNFRPELVVDYTGGSKSVERDLAMNLYTLMSETQNPLIFQSPDRLWEMTADLYRGMGRSDLERYIGKKPQVMTDPGEMSSKELAKIKNGILPHTEPGQNVFQTLADLITYSRGPEASNMTPEQLSLLQVRIIGLQAELLKQVRQQRLEQEQGGGLPGPEGGVPQAGLPIPEAAPTGPGGLPPAGPGVAVPPGGPTGGEVA